jgi:KDO2-lipid IV(A) lauroyltransferase
MRTLNAVFYYGFLLPVSRLPMGALYVLSDLIYLFGFRIAGYRRKVVYDNLRGSFPEKSEAEIDRIARAFYHHFCDIVVESIKSFTISAEEIRERFSVRNPEVLDAWYDRGRSVILAGGHYNNWEWLAVGLPQHAKHAQHAIYKPLSNRFFDEKARRTRERFGLRMLPMKETKALFDRIRAGTIERPVSVIFGVDQSPGDPRKSHWMRFLGRDTGVQFGAEKYARETGLPVVYGVIRKKARGRYELEFTDLGEDFSSVPKGGIMERIMGLLEEEIRRAPEWWLWTHRRWKHKKPE